MTNFLGILVAVAIVALVAWDLHRPDTRTGEEARQRRIAGYRMRIEPGDVRRAVAHGKDPHHVS